MIKSNHEGFAVNKEMIGRLEKEYRPILARLEALQLQYQELITELQKAASVGEEARAELGDSLSVALEQSRKAMAMDNLALIQDRKLISEPSGENLDAISLANKRNAVPDEQKEIQMILHIPKDIQANYDQLIVSAERGTDIGDFIKISVEQAEKQLAKFQAFLKIQ